MVPPVIVGREPGDRRLTTAAIRRQLTRAEQLHTTLWRDCAPSAGPAARTKYARAAWHLGAPPSPAVRVTLLVSTGWSGRQVGASRTGPLAVLDQGLGQ